VYIKTFLKNTIRSTFVHNVLAYSLAVLVVSLFVWLKLAVLGDLSRETPFLFILFSVFISAYYSGLGPGVLATMLSVLALIYFFMPPVHSFSISYRSDLEVIITYILVGVGVSWLLEQLRQQRTSLEARVERRTQQLKIANDELSRSNKELQDFAYIASHDLQEPLRKILAFGDRLSSKYQADLPEDVRGYVERMVKAADRMRLLVEGLLEYARIGAKEAKYSKVSLDKVLKDVLSDMELSILEKKAKMEIGKLGEIESDEIQLRQLFQNMISNSLKFHPPEENPKIIIASQRINTFNKISIEDEGIGIPEKYQDKIFSIFQRLHGRSEYDGTGIGLAVVRRIVERHGGKIVVSGRQGKGTKFEIYLPLNQKGRRYASKF
jgi:signal transduction histidine kinase